jgi:Ni/Fe-hydrogenase 1 B-type cytochrome subunit
MSDNTTPTKTSETGETAETAAGVTLYVYEWAVRAWRWIIALWLIVLAVTGYFISNPLPTMPGEASEHFTMGYIRFTHFATAYIFAVIFLGRIYWALAGNHYARQLFWLPLLNRAWWRGLVREIRWYAFLDKHPTKYIEHNPLAHLSMFLAITLGGTFMIITGFAMYGEGAQSGSWAHTMFSSWVIPLFGQSQNLHTAHHVVAWFIVCFMIVHVYVSIREEIMLQQTNISAMITGTRTFRK